MKQTIVLLLFCVHWLQAYDIRFVYNKNLNGHIVLSSFLQDMRRVFNRSMFVETGTYLGDTTKVAAALFAHVHSVEVSNDLYEWTTQQLQSYSNIQLYRDHSVFFLDRLCSTYQAEAGTMLFWLDAHYSGGITTLYQDVLTPIVDELEVLARHNMRDAVIMIDDIRCFGSLYQEQTIAAHPGYPSIQKVCTVLKTINPNYTCALYGDTLIAYDATLYHPSMSPIAYACTVSRLYDGYNESSETIVEQEAHIALADGQESAAISLLYQRALCQPDDFHAFVWYGLLIEKTDPLTAQTAFKTVIERGYTDWRIYWYLAKTAYALADYEQALRSVEQVLEKNPSYAPATRLQQTLLIPLSSPK